MENVVDCLLDKTRLNCVYLTNKHINNHFYYEHSEKGRAPHTNGPRDVPPGGGVIGKSTSEWKRESSVLYA
jgi:hypothetical protein